MTTVRKSVSLRWGVVASVAGALLLTFATWLIVVTGESGTRVRQTEADLKLVAHRVARYVGANPFASCQQVLAAVDVDAKDSWGTQVVVLCEGTRITIRSNGSDGRPGTEDDLLETVEVKPQPLR